MGSHKLDLRTGQSVWKLRRRPPVPHRPLRRDVRVDVLVVGAGVSGAMAAQRLAEAGHTVAIVDRRGPIEGSTPASTALVQYEIDVPLVKLAPRIGRRKAERTWLRSRLAVDALRDTVMRLEIDASMETRDSLYLSGDVLDHRGLEEEAEARRRIGLSVEVLEPREVARRYGARRRAALKSFSNLLVDPVRLTAGLLVDAIARGARVFAPEEIVAIDTSKRGVTTRTRSGRTIFAHHCVLATGYELWRGVPAKKHHVASTWAFATAPQPRRLWQDRAMMWEASDPYLYLRITPSGRIVCGGEDEDFVDERARDALLSRKVERLEQKLHALLPDIDPRAEVAWTGSFGTSSSGTPSIGRVPGMPGCFAVLGYGGNGITFSMIAAQLIESEIAGRGDADGDLFTLRR